jgi:hypothetical protein
MQLRSKKAMEIRGFLRRPQTLLPEFTLETDVEEYKKSLRKYIFYVEVSNSIDYNNNILNRINSKNEDLYLHVFNSVKNTSLDSSQLAILKKYNVLKNSEMYDESICKMGLLQLDGNYYLSIYFPIINIKVVNSDQEVEIRDIYFYLKNSYLYAFRTTLDIINPDFIHPHISANFNSFCLGSSPLKVSLDTLHYNPNDFTEVDADIFWVNLYRTVTQKTELGDHYYALSKLENSMEIDWSSFLDIVYNDDDFVNNILSYSHTSFMEEEIKITLDLHAIKNDYFHLFSYETSKIKDTTKKLEGARNVSFNKRKMNKINLTSIYKRPRALYKNIDSLLNMLLQEIAPTSLINKTYDDYKESLKQSNNSGEQSTGQNQVFEFQML